MVILEAVERYLQDWRQLLKSDELLGRLLAELLCVVHVVSLKDFWLDEFSDSVFYGLALGVDRQTNCVEGLVYLA